MAAPQCNLSTSFIATLTTICCISGVLAVVQNLAVLFAVRKFYSLRPTARHFMASLAAAELLSGFIANLYFILNHSKKDRVFIKHESAVVSFTTASVTFSLSNVALDRYIAITSPLRYHSRMTSTRCSSLIIFSWCLALLSASMVYLIPEENLVELWICRVIILVLIPFCIIAFSYFTICRATRSTYPVRENMTDAQQIAENKRQRKAAYTFGIVTGLYVAFFMPYFIFSCIELIANPPDLNDLKCHDSRRKAWIYIAVISYFSAIFDPWVYAIKMRDFRRVLKELFQSLCRTLHLHVSVES